jgi:hypothetical protein
MDNHKSRTARAPRELWPRQHCHDDSRSQLVGEGSILELISLGGRLPGILNRLCIAIDVQIGNVVSLVVLPNAEEDQLGPLTKTAMQVGLNVFSSTGILSPDKSLLGTFHIYCCDQRRPTRQECELIGRVVQLAAIALQRNRDKEDFEKPCRHLRNKMSDSSPLKQFIN